VLEIVTRSRRREPCRSISSAKSLTEGFAADAEITDYLDAPRSWHVISGTPRFGQCRGAYESNEAVAPDVVPVCLCGPWQLQAGTRTSTTRFTASRWSIAPIRWRVKQPIDVGEILEAEPELARLGN